jgi:hypothetical protein
VEVALMGRFEIVVFTSATLLLVFVIEVVRRRRLAESYALLWMAVGAGVIAVAVLRPVLDGVAEAIGVTYGANLFFALAVLFLLVVCMNLTMHISRLEERVTALAEEVAFLHGPVEPTDDDKDGRAEASS